MKKTILSAAIAISATGLFGAAVDAMTTQPNVLVTSIAARQRFPWNGKVDIDFSFTCDNPDAFAFIQFAAYYVDKNGTRNEVPVKTFDQITLPWCTNAGTYRVTWDSCADAPGLQATNLVYSVTANMAKYMVVDLSKGTSATAAKIVKEGEGEMIMQSRKKQHTGGTIVNGGTLTVNHADGLSSGAVTVNNDATLAIRSGCKSGTGAVTLNGTSRRFLPDSRSRAISPCSSMNAIAHSPVFCIRR